MHICGLNFSSSKIPEQNLNNFVSLWCYKFLARMYRMIAKSKPKLWKRILAETLGDWTGAVCASGCSHACGAWRLSALMGPGRWSRAPRGPGRDRKEELRVFPGSWARPVSLTEIQLHTSFLLNMLILCYIFSWNPFCQPLCFYVLHVGSHYFCHL